MSAHSTNTPLVGTLHREGFFSHLIHMIALRRQRKDLAQLDDHALKDIGVSRYDAHIEARRPAWDVPGHWLS